MTEEEKIILYDLLVEAMNLYDDARSSNKRPAIECFKDEIELVERLTGMKIPR